MNGLMINLDTIIGMVLGLPLGILIGYTWRARISRRHRAEYLAEREQERRAALGARNAQPGEREPKPSIHSVAFKRGMGLLFVLGAIGVAVGIVYVLSLFV